MHAVGITRLVVVTAFGIGDTRKHLPFAFWLFYRTVPREHMAGKEKQAIVVKASGLDWTPVQPFGLTDGPATNTCVADIAGGIRRNQISRTDVAAFLISMVPSGQHSHATVSLSG